MLFIDYGLTFNTIVPSKLIIKLEAMGLNPALYNWVLDFLIGRPQVLKEGNNTSTSLILNTGAPQGCTLSPLLYSLFTHDCVAMHASNSIIKFADDTIAITLHTALSHLDKRYTYVRMLLIDYSSAFNTIVPSKLIIKLEALGLNHALCNWVLDFLTGHPQVMKVGNNISTC